MIFNYGLGVEASTRCWYGFTKALKPMCKYIKPTIDLNDAIHDLKYMSLLDWRQTTYYLLGCTLQGGDPPFLRPSAEEHSRLTWLRKEALNSSFSLEKPISWLQ